ncbi:fumarylacetoacetate hydrolase family protein [Haloactinomyces albus]|uniref:Regulator of RNase E activity RraA/2-keto-4-pentenoate hydratase/2-oxohepta-3-ene-1,7-dioic acid hydratase in catechol pathway n=1 Tax=Haloactinomyces albus TaxID=1352928 RepID=A0AAE3ZI39_9ACTN|nr:fumarylacetoacetate hydrolase family protein [Haloactinomyces albus]MDR7303622.1 regulator of RNase E activity RraA/2-keto-4-pentenoate hydratase/2-oxohepta-3-ene-1,7-dioic acid hydratase in catechol pathway [Haloactinomyces albus]
MSDPITAATGYTPSKVIAVHLNYPSRAAERGRTPTHGSYFLKAPSSLAATGGDVPRPAGAELLGFEGEIALVIGTQARAVTPDQGWSHVGWVTAANDLGLYDMRYADSGSNVRSKSGDGFTPLGPDMLPAAELDPTRLRVRTWINGELAQSDTTDTLLFGFGELIADLSRLSTLHPGDVLLTGTPAGASVVTPGDVMEVEVDSVDLARPVSTRRLRSTVTEGPKLAEWGAQPKSDDALRAAAHGSTAADEQRDDAELMRRLSRVGVATLSAQLRKRGLNNVHIDGVHPAKQGESFAGRARTLRYVPLREDLFTTHGGGFNAQKQVIDTVAPGEVVVMEARGDASAGTIGDILALRAQVRGAAAVVTDGAVRDSVVTGDLDIPVFSGAAHPAVLGRRHVPWDSDVAIACGGTTVRPGDIVVGDDDGALVIPPDLADELADAAAEQERKEEFIAEQVRAGAGIEDLYPMNAQWEQAYEQWQHDTREQGSRGHG